MEKLVIATRGSRLALWQANHVKDSLEAVHPGLAVELNIIKTKGDIILDVPLAKVGGKGLFVKEIEEALLSGAADIAVHSMKDVPMELPEGPHPRHRAGTRGPHGPVPFGGLRFAGKPPAGAVVGTSSLRRQAQVLAQRPDLEVVSLRGNVDTRLRKLTEGAVRRHHHGDGGHEAPRPVRAQGVPARPARVHPRRGAGRARHRIPRGPQDLAEMLSFMEHRPTRICVEAERGLLAGLDGGCQVPIAGHAEMLDDGTFELEGLVGEVDGSVIIRRKVTGRADEARAVGFALARSSPRTAGAEILARVYAR